MQRVQIKFLIITTTVLIFCAYCMLNEVVFAEPWYLGQMASAQQEQLGFVSSVPATAERLAGKGLKMLLKIIFGKWYIPLLLGIAFIGYLFSRHRD